MSKYLDYLRDACDSTPTWWWLLSVIVAFVSLAITLSGATPPPIRHNWVLFGLILFGLLFVAITVGMFKMHERQRNSYEARLTELQGKVNTMWDEKAQEAQEMQDAREIPEVIKEMRTEQGSWMRENGIVPGTPGVHKDENWFVEKLKFKRPERIVRKAYKEWPSR